MGFFATGGGGWLVVASCRLLRLVAETLLIGRMLERNKKNNILIK